MLHNKQVPPENNTTFNHGIFWHPHGIVSTDKPESMSELVTSVSLQIRDVMDGNLRALAQLCEDLGQNMHSESMRHMYQKISEITERTGNTVSAEQMGTAGAFLEMLRKIEFGVDANGRPVIPSVHAAPATADKLARELSEQGPAFEAEIEKIKAEKISQALDREKARRARFIKNEQ